jgi:hypothetical protein
MRVRVALGVALVLVAGTLILDMSGRAPRTAGSDHTSSPVFAATVPGGGVLCQPSPILSNDAARVQVLIGTYGRPVPDLLIRFLDPAGTEIAAGHLQAGAREGYVTIPISRVRRAPAPTSVCLRVGGSSNVVLGGESGAVNPGSEFVDGKLQPGRISLFYLRRGEESWWQLLPTLTRRFGLGKASLFGDWTLPVLAALLLGVWAGAVRLLSKELT